MAGKVVGFGALVDAIHVGGSQPRHDRRLFLLLVGIPTNSTNHHTTTKSDRHSDPRDFISYCMNSASGRVLVVVHVQLLPFTKRELPPAADTLLSLERALTFVRSAIFLYSLDHQSSRSHEHNTGNQCCRLGRPISNLRCK